MRRIYKPLVILAVSLILILPSQQGTADTYSLGRMEAFSWVLLQLKQDYVDPSRIDPQKMTERIFDYIERRIPEVEINMDSDVVKIQVGSNTKQIKSFKPSTVWEMNYNLQPIFKFIEDNLEADSDPKDVEFAAINGMLSTLDPHSNLLPPELFREMQLKTTGEFGGLGIRITIRKGALTIISPLPDTPAARLGLKALDQIVRIGDQSTVNMPLDEAVNLLRGKPGSKVAIWVKRPSWSEAHKYLITRETIRVRSITSKLLEHKIGYIQIQDFSRHTGGDLLRNLSDLKRQAKGLKGLVLDLRNNAGGLLKAAVQVADLFLDRGIIVATVAYGEDSTEEMRVQKSREEQRAKADGVESELPIVVLVNSGSASASEILAGALKNLDRAVLMGEQTFGKGTVQVLNDRVPQSVEGACLKLTVAEYLIPGDISIQEVGVTPDIKLIPMVLDKNDMQVFAQPERLREEDIPKHLKKQQELISTKPNFELRYVYDAPKPKEDEEPPLQETEFREDFEIRLARDFLTKVTSPRGSAMLDEGGSFLNQVKKRELDAMAKALVSFGIDWSKGTSSDTQSSVEYMVTGEKIGPKNRSMVHADTHVMLNLSVTNKGQSPYYQLRAESRSPIFLFDRREFLFGKVDPGKTIKRQVKIKVPRGITSRTDELHFQFFCDGGKPPETLKTNISVKGLERPSFGYSWRVLDPKGNGDGLIQPGEKIDLELTVHNLGAGKAFDTRARLKNEAGKDLFIEAGGGNLTYKEIEPGKSKSMAFRFSVREDTKKELLPIEFTIWDTALSVTQVAEVELPVSPKSPRVKVVRVGLKVKRNRAAVRGGASAKSPLVAFAKKNSLLASDRLVGDWYRIKGKKKVLGWIHRSAVRRAGSPKATPRKALLSFVQHTPPRILLKKLPAFVESEDKVILRGQVTNDMDLRDVAVWVGNRKIHLEAGNKMPNPRQTPIEVDVPLEPGANLISVIAREGTRFSSHRTLVITRPGGLEKQQKDGFFQFLD